MPSLYVIGGANGSGKTTVAMNLLPNFLECFEYLTALWAKATEIQIVISRQAKAVPLRFLDLVFQR
ncbi:hypothetical protein WA1_20370 [Scytonema hofmannii PCC 7110]|jgi:predicted ABC-type ATPase|uniref:Uncharacterized protein n=1 Tax=Scytonema hofmannii PCC 7110 TaxID=128403 RepID=A0A139XCB1_9CYAN|nr:hypothetical protein [Scytonema hofmannii]KYC42330.1 hypothetical protein WA1_20370 [Scytonema hofmannii PCC 7110]